MSDVTQPITNPTTLVDQDRIRWPGSGSSVVGKTPFGLYDNDYQFQADAQSAAIWAAYQLGYPVVDVEMLDVNFYAAFEQAVNEYSSQVNQWNIRNYMQVFQGQKVSELGNLTGKAVKATPLPYVIELAKGYGTEVGVGGYVDWKKGFVVTHPGQQSYDLQEIWGNQVENCNRIEIMRIFHDFPPAFARIYDPFSMTGMSYSNVLNARENGSGQGSVVQRYFM
jgi:hypothetical protein